MAFDERIAERVRGLLQASPHASEVAERKMFGGVCFMLAGNMAVGVHDSDLIVRVDPSETEALLAKPHTRPFDLSRSRLPPRGWLLVAPEGTKTARSLGTWVARGTDFARSLPAK